MTGNGERHSGIEHLSSLSRREVVAGLALAGGGALFGPSGLAFAQSPRSGGAELAARAHDWDWLLGNWDVWHRRLKVRLAGSTEWDEFAGKSNFWLTLGGLGNIDDNILDLPGGTYRGTSIRAFDPASGNWSIWWLDGRYPTRIDPPVMGRFDGDGAAFIGHDTFNGNPITVRFRWLDVHGSRPHWEQAFSTDGGATWEVNWVNFFTRTAAAPTPQPVLGEAGSAPGHGDWDFLVGSWAVRHRRLKRRLAGNNEWEEFDGTLVNWPILGGRGNVGDNVLHLPGGTYRGVGLRAFDPAGRQWLSWWLDGRNPATIAPPVRGGFTDGIGTFIGDDSLDGRPIRARVTWSRITRSSARWEQAFSADGGATWETNWTSDFIRRA
jgi:hypothetical protein